MADRRVYDCDRCGVKDIGVGGRLVVPVGRSMCPSGNGSEEKTETVDLCQGCMASILMLLVTKDKVDGPMLMAMAREKKARKT